MVFGKWKSKKASGRKYSKGILENHILAAGVVNGGLVASDTTQDLIESTLDNALAVDYAIFNSHDFSFENLVMEGGGMKGLAYVGALKVMYEAGVLENIKRFCGVSVGSILSLFAYVGFTPDEIREIMYENLDPIVADHRCGICSLLPNLKRGFGWNPGKSMEKWLKSKIKIKLGDPDITFKEAYEKTGREFCVVVTNLNRMATEYFHVKTTPDVELSLAVYASAAIPAIYQGRFIEKGNGEKDLYVDGGLLCNYPIHVFDGWWLSMKPEDSFFKKMSMNNSDISRYFDKSERFGEWNDATIGMLLYAEDEIEVMKRRFMDRQGAVLPRPPKNSKLYRQRKHARHREQNLTISYDATVQEGITSLMEVMKSLDVKKVNCIPLEQLREGLDKCESFHGEHLKAMFNIDSIDELMDEINADGDDEITHVEFCRFAEKKGLDLFSHFYGYNRREIKNLADYFSAIEAGLSVNLMKSYVESRDADRTIGINTGYLETTDFFIEEDDKIYLEECGAIAARAFLREHCRNNPHKRQQRSKMMASKYFTGRRRSLLTQKFLEMVDREEEKMRNNPEYRERMTSLTSYTSEDENEEDEQNEKLSSSTGDTKK